MAIKKTALIFCDCLFADRISLQPSRANHKAEMQIMGPKCEAG